MSLPATILSVWIRFFSKGLVFEEGNLKQGEPVAIRLAGNPTNAGLACFRAGLAASLETVTGLFFADFLLLFLSSYCLRKPH